LLDAPSGKQLRREQSSTLDATAFRFRFEKIRVAAEGALPSWAWRLDLPSPAERAAPGAGSYRWCAERVIATATRALAESESRRLQTGSGDWESLRSLEPALPALRTAGRAARRDPAYGSLPALLAEINRRAKNIGSTVSTGS
jgi:hypothetical protein